MFRKSAASTPPISEHAKLRSKQINEFVKLHPQAQLMQSGAGGNQSMGVSDATVTYAMQLMTQAGPLQLLLLLGPLFPERPPMLQLTALHSGMGGGASIRLHHRYLDALGFLSLHPKLQATQWSPHQNLGILVQDIIREILAQPPMISNAATTPPFAAAGAGAGSVAAASPAPAGAMNQSPYVEQQQQQQLHQMQQAAQQQAYQPYGVQPQQNYILPSQQQQQQQQPAPAIPRRPSGTSGSNNGPGLPASNSSSSLSSSASPGPGPALAPLTRSRPPDIPSSFPILDTLSIAQLEELSADPQALRDLSAEVREVRELDATQAQLCARIRELATGNLARRTECAALHQALQHECLTHRTLQHDYAALQQRYQAAASRYALSNILAQLDAAIAQSETASDATRAKYESINQKIAAAAATAGGGGVVDADGGLLEQYIKERMLLHERQAKRERLTEMYGGGRR